MSPRLFITALFASAFAALGACGSSTTTNVTSPTTTRCQAMVTTSSSTFNASGGNGTASVGVSRECEWSASTTASWIIITAGSRGQGDGTITYRVDPNADPVERRGALAVGSSQAELSQQAAPCRYDLSGPSEAVPADGGNASIDVRTHSACSWSATVTDAWADVSPQSGKGSVGLRVTLGPNTGAARSTLVLVGDQRVSVSQAARALPSPVPAPQPSPAPAPNPPPAPSPTPDPGPGPAPAPSPVPVSPIQLDGKVGSVSGTCPAVTFALAGRTVFTTAATEFKKIPCQDIKVGTKVNVDGYVMSDGTVRADKVEKD